MSDFTCASEIRCFYPNDGAGKLFWGIKTLCSRCFLVAIKFFSHFIGKCQCKYAVRFEMKSR